MRMTLEQEQEHLDFLITRLQFMKVTGNLTEPYDRCREILKDLRLDVIDFQKEMAEDDNFNQ